jgi:hypothetical protein
MVPAPFYAQKADRIVENGGGNDPLWREHIAAGHEACRGPRSPRPTIVGFWYQQKVLKKYCFVERSTVL